MKRAGTHVTAEEVLELLECSDPASVPHLADVGEHIRNCPDCRAVARVLAKDPHHIQSAYLLTPESALYAENRSHSCPSEEDWMRLVTGNLEQSEREPLLNHLALCDFCGGVLREALRIAKEEISPEEQASIDRLQLSRDSGAQKKLIQRLTQAGNEQNSRTPLLPFRIWHWRAWGIAAAAVLLIVAAWIIARSSSDKPGDASAKVALDLLAAAYAKQRPFEPRFDGASYGPLKVARGGAPASRFDAPPELLQSDALISRGLEAHPNAAAWLHAKGRAELLEGNPGAAIATLDRARTVSHTESLLTDLACAYYQNASETQKKSDYGDAIELLSQVLASNPNNIAALFDRALAYEAQASPSLAIQDWQRYLTLDSTSGWAREARRHLADLELKKKSEPAVVR